MAEDYLQMEQERNMSKRDKARAKFIREFKQRQFEQKSLKNQVLMEREHYLDFREQIDNFGHLKASKLMRNMKYDELVETLNRDTKALEHLSGKRGAQLQLYKEEAEVTLETEKKQDEVLGSVKRVVWPLYLVGFLVVGLIWVGENEQMKLIEKNAKKL